jgi:hypothetical protein
MEEGHNLHTGVAGQSLARLKKGFTKVKKKTF